MTAGEISKTEIKKASRKQLMEWVGILQAQVFARETIILEKDMEIIALKKDIMTLKLAKVILK